MLFRSLACGERVRLEQVGLFADGVAVRQVGEHTFALARRLVDRMIIVSTDEICAAMKDVFDDTRAVMEPAGALAVAGLHEIEELVADEISPLPNESPRMGSGPSHPPAAPRATSAPAHGSLHAQHHPHHGSHHAPPGFGGGMARRQAGEATSLGAASRHPPAGVTTW